MQASLPGLVGKRVSPDSPHGQRLTICELDYLVGILSERFGHSRISALRRGRPVIVPAEIAMFPHA